MSPALPASLAAVLAQETAGHERRGLAEASESLSMSYRSRSGIRRNLSPVERAAYLATRFPSTFSVARIVWREVRALSAHLPLSSILDAGAGPGTASWAACASESPTRVTLLERDSGWQSSATAFARAMGADMKFVSGHLETLQGLSAHDAVIASYSLNELAPAQQRESVQLLWRLASSLLVIIEPGTPAGFATINAARRLVLDAGGHVIAPCTHQQACPVTGDDWCHFDAHVERTSLHRTLKSGTLSHEREKFSYVAFVRAPGVAPEAGRVVRRPIRASGHAHFDVCRAGEIRRVTVSKRQGDAWRAARDTDWGDLLDD
jgi:ribosomal protein RSM22 (predicted rRNA methylase)